MILRLVVLMPQLLTKTSWYMHTFVHMKYRDVFDLSSSEHT